MSRSEVKLDYVSSAKIKENISYCGMSRPLRKKYDCSKINNMGYVVIYNSKHTGNSAINEKQLANLDRLDNIALLDDDWNGYGSKRINAVSVAIARKIIRNIVEQPSIYPTGRDSIQLQYELQDKSYLEFEIFEDRITSMQVPQKRYEMATFQTLEVADIQVINEIVREFYGRECTKRGIGI